VAQFRFLDAKHKQKLLATSPATHYSNGILLYNCLTCLKGTNQVSQFFNLAPPTLSEYLA